MANDKVQISKEAQMSNIKCLEEKFLKFDVDLTFGLCHLTFKLQTLGGDVWRMNA